MLKCFGTHGKLPHPPFCFQNVTNHDDSQINPLVTTLSEHGVPTPQVPIAFKVATPEKEEAYMKVN